MIASQYRIATITALTPYICALILCLPSAALADAIYDVTVNTSAIDGTAATLAFDFIAGGGTETNSITISDFSSDGTLGTSGPASGSVTGSLPSTISLTDGSFFNEVLQGITCGKVIDFTLDATTNAPSTGSLPDTFSFFILDSTASYSLLTTTDPTGAESLFTLQIDGSAGELLGNYSSIPAVSATLVPSGSSVSVPEPGTMGLVLSGVLMFLWGRLIVLLRRSRL